MTESQTTAANSPSMTSRMPGWALSVCLAIGLWFLNSRLFVESPGTHFIGLIFVLVAFIFLILLIFKNGPASIILPPAFGIGGAIMVLLAEHAFIYLFFPYPLDDGEGFCLNQALLVALGKPLYQPIDVSPFIVTNYPPVFPWLLSFFTDPASPSFAAGRLISIVSTVIIAISAAGCVRAALGESIDRKTTGAITVFLVLASPVMYFWIALLRVDMLASALTMVGLWIAVASWGPKIYLSLPFLVAAIFTRQSSIEALAAIVLALFIGRKSDKEKDRIEKKTAIFFAVIWIVAVIVIEIILNVASDGQFWLHTVTYTRTRFYLLRIWSNIQWVLPSHALLILAALFALIPALKDPRRRILGIFFLAATATALLSGKVGSDLNYFINFIIASACLTGLMFHDLLVASRGSSAPKWIIAAMLIIPGILTQSGLMEGNRSLSFSPIREDYMNGRFITDTLASVNGPILAEDEGFCLLSGHEVVFNPFIMSELAREGIWDQTPLLEAIQNHEFDIIMLRFYVLDPAHDDRPTAGAFAGWDRFTDEMEQAIADSYDVDPAVSPIFMRRYWYIYRPKGLIPEPVIFPDIVPQEEIVEDSEDEAVVESPSDLPESAQEDGPWESVPPGDEAVDLLGGSG